MSEKGSHGGFTVTGVEISVFAHATEDEEKVERSIRNMIPEGVTEFKIERQALTGHYRDPITLITARIRRKKVAKEVLRAMMKALSALDRHRLLEEIEERSDRGGGLYLRLDKQAAFRGVGILNEIDPLRAKFKFWIPHGMDPATFIRSAIAEIIDGSGPLGSSETAK
jgi:RNA binding exosome subunit